MMHWLDEFYERFVYPQNQDIRVTTANNEPCVIATAEEMVAFIMKIDRDNFITSFDEGKKVGVAQMAGEVESFFGNDIKGNFKGGVLTVEKWEKIKKRVAKDFEK